MRLIWRQRTVISMQLLAWLGSVILGGMVTVHAQDAAEHGMETQPAGGKERIIIGIHGLLNKPPLPVLETGWHEAIEEGLHRNFGLTDEVPFKMVYWADVRNQSPLAENDEPYVKATGEGPLENYDPGIFDKARAIANKYAGRWADIEKQLIGLGTNIESLIGIKFDDLADYYDSPEIRQQMRSRLSEVLEQHRGKRIMLIAHSMGSIIAYDVLRTYDGSDTLVVDHFVTIGSPLGLPIVGHKVREEFGAPQTPTIVQRWTNIADPGDKVALDCALADEYTSNGAVRVRDVLTINGYLDPRNKPNNHKSYGYLRAPEVSETIRDFLVQEPIKDEYPGILGLIDVPVDMILDAKGLNPPLPILRAKKELQRLGSGETLLVVYTAPGAMRDFEAFAVQTGNSLLKAGEHDGLFYALLLKRQQL